MENKEVEEIVEAVKEVEEIVEKAGGSVDNLPAVTDISIPAEVMENSEGLNFKLIAALTGGAAAITGGVIGIRKLIKKRKAKKEEDLWEEIDLCDMDDKCLENYLEDSKKLYEEAKAEVAKRKKAASDEFDYEEEENDEAPKK